MRRIAIVLLLGALVATACGGDDGSEDAADGGGTSDAGTAGVLPASGGFGGRLQEGAQFSVVLFVLEQQTDAVDFVGVACAAGGILAAGVVTVAEATPLTDGSFLAESPDVRIEGSFVTPTRAEGTIEALTQNAMDCGIGQSASWVAECDLGVERVVPDPAEEGGVFIGGVTATTENGTAFGMLEVIAQNGDRLKAELDAAGACGAA